MGKFPAFFSSSAKLQPNSFLLNYSPRPLHLPKPPLQWPMNMHGRRRRGERRSSWQYPSWLQLVFPRRPIHHLQCTPSHPGDLSRGLTSAAICLVTAPNARFCSIATHTSPPMSVFYSMLLFQLLLNDTLWGFHTFMLSWRGGNSLAFSLLCIIPIVGLNPRTQHSALDCFCFIALCRVWNCATVVVFFGKVLLPCSQPPKRANVLLPWEFLLKALFLHLYLSLSFHLLLLSAVMDTHVMSSPWVFYCTLRDSPLPMENKAHHIQHSQGGIPSQL